jgi:hypothetical protein
MLTLSIYFDASSISIKQFDLLRTSAVVLREVATSDSFVVRNKTTRGNDFTKNNKLVGCWRFHLEVDVSEALRDDMRARNPRILSSRTAAVLGRCAAPAVLCAVCAVQHSKYSTQLCPSAVPLSPELLCALLCAVLRCAALCCAMLCCSVCCSVQQSTVQETPKPQNLVQDFSGDRLILIFDSYESPVVQLDFQRNRKWSVQNSSRAYI